MSVVIKKSEASPKSSSIFSKLAEKSKEDKIANLKKLSDEKLAAQFKKGNEQAFSILMARFQRPIYNYLYKFLRHNEMVEESFQEVFLRVVRSIKDYKPSSKFSTWVYTIARNYAIDVLRKQKFRRHLSLDQSIKNGGEDSDTNFYNFNPSDDHTSEQIVLTHEVQDQLQTILEQINPEQREVFLLRETQDLSFEQISEITGVSVNTVKSRMRYALKAIQNELDERGITQKEIL